MKPHFQEYESRAALIHGWMPPAFTRVVALIDSIQENARTVGPVAEIGVHCGRSFAPLVLMKRPEEIAYALDCFDDQSANTGRSGGATEKQFRESMAKACIPMHGVEVVRCNTSKDPHPLRGCFRPGAWFRVVSIDGDHSALGTLRDMEAARDCLGDGGVMILDDAFNDQWPAVSEGLHTFLTEEKGMSAVLAGFGKIVLAYGQVRYSLRDRVGRPEFGLRVMREQQFHREALLSIEAV